jgi:predicted flap endonuclease-1-like 5' DNA nuclease
VRHWPERTWAIEGCQGIGLIPGGAQKSLSAAQAKALLATVRPRDAAGKARRRVAAELISDLERVYQRKKAADNELRELLKATATTLTDLHGIGPSAAARILAEVGDITRFPAKGHFASWNGTARLTPPPGTRSATGYPGQATGRSTGPCTSWPSFSSVTRLRAGPTTTGKSPQARPPWKRCAA